MLQQLTVRLDAQDIKIDAQNAKIDSLAHLVDSLAKLVHGGSEVDDGQPCPGAKTVSDGTNTYNTVKIGNQCWMAQNLRTDVGGGVYPKKNNVTVTGADTVTYGRLYSWTAMMNGAISSNNVPSGVRGICPEGWHVPSDAEWDTLTKYVYNSANPDYKCSGCESSVWEQSTKCIAKALASTTGWSSNTSEGCNAGNTGDKANATGFAAVPAGYCLYDSFSRFGSLAYFWSATQGDGRYAWCRILSSNGSGVGRDFDLKDSGFSVRCLRDAGTGGGGTTPVPVEVSCEQVMECMGDTLGKLNTKIVDLNATVTTQGAEIETLNNTVQSQGEKIDSLAHVVDSLAKLPHGGGEVADGQPCPGAPTVSDGTNTYNTVKIGNQCWMKENLRTKLGTDGDKGYPTSADADSLLYGRLYTWTAVTKGASTNYTVGGTNDTIVRGICPEGWHVPSDAEWDTLTNYVNSVADYKCGRTDKAIANALSSPTGWTNLGECGAGHNSTTLNKTGFAAVPAGACMPGSSLEVGLNAYFWSATQEDDVYAWYRGLRSNGPGVSRFPANKDGGFSVRCLKN